MRWDGLIAAIAGLGVLATAPTAGAEPPPVSVMIVADFHMANPGRDLHNLKVDDVLAPRRQAEIAAVVQGLSRFRPTEVAAESDPGVAPSKYAAYVQGRLPPTRNEVVQLAFRLAKQAGLSTVHGIDAEGDFPYERVEAYAKAHGGEALLDRLNAGVEAMVQRQAEILRDGGIAAELRYLNDPRRIENDNGFYRSMLKIGSGADQPGADLLTAWYRRNFLICANILQLAKPGDRIVVFYGAGHAFLLRQCARETPGFRLVEPNGYLPK